MSTASRPAPSRLLRNARVATGALFFTNGALFSNLLPRYPAIKSGLDLTNTEFGLVVIAFPVGAIISGLAAAAAIRRFGAANVAVIGTVLTAAGLVAVGWAPALWLIVAALFVAGSADSITDVGQNSHGIAVQRGYGRSIINSFHAVWSAGAVTGGLMGTAAAANEVPLGLHLTVSSVVWVLVAFVARRFTLPAGMSVGPPLVEEHHTAGGPAAAWLRRPPVLLAALVLIAMSGTMVEDAGNTWSAVFLTQELDAGPALAGLAFVATVGAQFVGRVLGDPMTDRLGQRAVARLGAALIIVGMGLVVLGPSSVAVIAGFALAGFGSATLVPAAMNAADDMPGMRAGNALTIVSWLMRVAFVVSPPLVGAIGDAAGLRAGLAVVPVLAVGTLLLAGVLRGRER
ncbi:Fucose permease [Georgenia satyanarayanai]|uniref:Fucose permease n=1 Tax=Georgenia satyanarayanai TaxID=860221 RepID=A0A2Y9AN71_9MICO|nr:MFS transporter [Georgenia satyanarayanai]PYF98930.1 fucose permease [Georgenia satyanarayanai]SSA44778.1 Fucose permease [Georgenia satyanarayanai]